MMRHVITGGSQAIVGGLTGKKLEKLTGDVPYLAVNGEDLHRDVRSIAECLQYICHKEEDKALKPFYKPVVLQPGLLIPMHNESHNRTYNMALAATSTVVQFKVPGLGQAFTLTLQAGWNILNMPDSTEWGLPASASGNISLIYCASNSMFGNAI